MAPLVNLNKNITYLRKINGFTQKDMAELLKIDRSTYAKYETGDLHPPVVVVCKLCYIYKISADVLLELDIDKGDDKELLAIFDRKPKRKPKK